MDSSKIGPNVSGGLSNTGTVAKAKGVQQDAEAKKVKEKSADVDYNVKLSGQAKEMNEARLKALEIARNTPDVREEKIAELKAKIANGDYKFSAENIADGMMREAIKDELSKGKPEL